MNQAKYTPVIIIGAPRSGTNMLRDILCQFSDFGTWPCDEINYIWRHGNVRYESDEFPKSLATNDVKAYIRKQFDSIAAKLQTHYLLEKTCANSLRVEFVNETIPDAKYIFLVRDGVDIVDSAMKRWKAPLDIPYLLKKMRYVPVTDLPYYGSRYILNRVYRLFSRENRLAFWGPKLDNIDTLLADYSLEEVCFLQWQKCVTSSEEAFSRLPDGKVYTLRYEDFVTEPKQELEKILSFLDSDVDTLAIEGVLDRVSSTSVGKGRSNIDDDMIERLMTLGRDTLSRYNYEVQSK